MTANASLRRLLVTIGVAGSLLAAGATIRAASLWAAADAPLTVAPVSVTAVQDALEQERARSAALEAELATLASSAADLRDALGTAQAQVVSDRAAADDLRASLTTAQHKLRSLEAALRAAAPRGAATSGGGAGTSEDAHDDGGGEHDD